MREIGRKIQDKRSHYGVFLISIVVAGALTTGCAQRMQQGNVEPPKEDPVSEHIETDDLPRVALTADLLYEILLGEIALQRGHVDEAARAMTSAAKSSGDYRLAERASVSALRAKDYDQALQAAEMWAELQPDATQPLETIGRILIAKGRIEEAEAHLKKLIKRGEPDVGAVYRRIADILTQQGNAEEILGVMDRLVQLHPNDANAHFSKAYLADRLESPEIVLESLDKALSIKPDWEDAALAKFSYFVTKKDFERAGQFSEKYLKDHPDASKLRLHYARYLIDQDKREIALQNFKLLIDDQPKNADALFAAGLLSVQLDRFADAENYLQRNVDIRPDNDQARLYLGQIAAEQEQYDKAESWYRKITSEALYFDAQLLLANVIAKQKGTSDALEHLEGLHPRDTEEQVRIILSKEQILRAAKDMTRAKEILDEGLEQFPDDSDLLYARGLVAAQLELITLHEQDMRRLLEKDPKNAHALNALGYTLADQTDRYQEALDLINQALKLKPDDPFIMDSMGWVHYRLGNHQLAIEYLERALKKREDAEISAHLGEVLWMIGEKTRAEKILKRALKKAPDNDVLLTTIEKLKQ